MTKTPPQVRADIARLLADGRERTVEEIAERIGVRVMQVQRAMPVFMRLRLVTSDYLTGPKATVYRKKLEAAE